jgi:hypothetical protein
MIGTISTLRHIYFAVSTRTLTSSYSAVSGCHDVATIARGSPDLKISDNSIKPWMTTFAVTTWCTNAIGTSLIAYKLWNSRRRFGQLSGNPGEVAKASHSALVIVIESAGIYLVAITAFLVTYLADSTGQFTIVQLVSAALPPRVEDSRG